MTASNSAYTVGRGRPPLHTRFKKGQSGNPSGKPGPARLAKQRFQRALFAALEGTTEELELAKPDKVIAALARRMALDAVAGRGSAQRQLLSLLDAETEKEVQAEERGREPSINEADLFSLLQGKTQGNVIECLEDILWPGVDLAELGPDARTHRERAPEPSPAAPRNEAQPFSLPQGKKQGRGKIFAEQICPAHGWKRAPATSGHN
ncbi:MAG TPA: DUF5681 domain-containing protein [Rhizomicrobium sp.]|jgi:hypothetical protein|nr:DUF5681 domain-containing protein [Rhizomicrobium sp.]